MKGLLISTKANTLADLKETVKHSYIEDLYIVYADVFFEDPAVAIAAIETPYAHSR